MKKLPVMLLVLFACCALAACKNPWVTELLKAPSELSSLDVTAYAGDQQLQGGASFEPGFSPSKRKYTVYVPLETSRFIINPVFDGSGTVVWETEGMNIDSDPAKLEFDFFDAEDSINLTLIVERENMSPGKYHLTVTRGDNIPPPKGIVVSVTPAVGTYFLNADIIPVVEVQAEEPLDGGVLSYQWFRNEDNNNATGTMLHGETGTSYTLSDFEVEEARTMYYYAEVTKTLNGKMVTLASLPRSVTFIDREEALSVKSGRDASYWVNVPAGEVKDEHMGGAFLFNDSPGTAGSKYWAAGSTDIDNGDYIDGWKTDGFLIGKYPVTYELWEAVRSYAELENYKFARVGYQGTNNIAITQVVDPVGGELHPVTMIGWRDAAVWCNAFSEMSGLEPVYLDSNGNVLRDSRINVELLLDESKMEGKNGYRLPTFAELEYAFRGADPDNENWKLNGWFDGSGWVGYWNPPPALIPYAWYAKRTTDEVGGPANEPRLPNSIGLYDMFGMVLEWTYTPYTRITTLGIPWRSDNATNNPLQGANPSFEAANTDYGFRLIRYEEAE